jgi:hypothetical protein
MYYILAFAICSAVTGDCTTPRAFPTQFDKWSECVISGSEITIEYATQMEEQINKDKLYITYFCNENISDKTPT